MMGFEDGREEKKKFDLESFIEFFNSVFYDMEGVDWSKLRGVIFVFEDQKVPVEIDEEIMKDFYVDGDSLIDDSVDEEEMNDEIVGNLLEMDREDDSKGNQEEDEIDYPLEEIFGRDFLLKMNEEENQKSFKNFMKKELENPNNPLNRKKNELKKDMINLEENLRYFNSIMSIIDRTYKRPQNVPYEEWKNLIKKEFI